MDAYEVAGFRFERKGGSWWADSGLGLGLNVYTKDLGHMLDEFLGISWEAKFGDAVFDEQFWLQCNDVDRLTVLFTAPIRAEFMSLHLSDRLQVRDDVFVWPSETQTDGETMKRVAVLLGTLRDADHGLPRQTRRPSRPVRPKAPRPADRAYADTGLDWGLSIGDRDVFDRINAWLGQSKNVVLVGNKEFDEQFLVRCRKPGAMAAAMTPEVCREIIDLYNFHDVQLRNDTFSWPARAAHTQQTAKRVARLIHTLTFPTRTDRKP